MVFIPGKGGALTGGADRQYTGDPVFNLKINKLFKPLVIDPVAQKRGYDRCLASCFHVGPSLQPVLG